MIIHNQYPLVNRRNSINMEDYKSCMESEINAYVIGGQFILQLFIFMIISIHHHIQPAFNFISFLVLTGFSLAMMWGVYKRKPGLILSFMVYLPVHFIFLVIIGIYGHVTRIILFIGEFIWKYLNLKLYHRTYQVVSKQKRLIF